MLQKLTSLIGVQNSLIFCHHLILSTTDNLLSLSLQFNKNKFREERLNDYKSVSVSILHQHLKKAVDKEPKRHVKQHTKG